MVRRVNHILCRSVLVLIVCSSLLGQAPRVAGQDQTCTVVRPGIRIPCPPGWNLLNEEPDSTVIADFPRTAENRNRMSGPGMATISVFSIPKHYEDLARWIWVGRKNAPDATETKLTVANEATGRIQVVRLTSPTSSGSTSASYFFQLGRTPVLIEVVHRAQDPKNDDYRATAQWMIERATLTR